MLDDAQGTNCQSTNFCNTVGVLAQSTFNIPSACMHPEHVLSAAHNLIELMDYGVESQDHNYAHMIQSFHRFLMDTLSAEGNAYPQNPWLLPPASPVQEDVINVPPAPSPITQLCGVDARNVVTCTSCGAIREKENMVHVVDLSYPKKVCVCSYLSFVSFV